jgi:hypothetical protein
MLLLFVDDRRYRGGRRRVAGGKLFDLILQMAQYDIFHCNGGRCNRLPAAERGEHAQCEAAKGAHPVTATPWLFTPLKFSKKDRAMTLLVRSEFNQLSNELGRSNSRDQNLPRVDTDRAVLACVIDL